MISRHYILLVLAISVLPFVASAPAHAQRVGEAAVVKNQVVRVTGSGGSQINVGDALLRNETVRTGADSAARLVLIDSTNLSLGPSATLTLDRTVFNDERSYREISIRLATGAFRFVTGNSDKNAYKITTGLATIGVRGTTLHILSQLARSTVVLGDAPGAALVCTRGGLQCTSLTQPGDTAIINLFNGQTTIQKTNNPPWTFACGAAAGLCSTTQYADATPPGDDGSDPTGMLCGR
jgi:ferric-dicitrate binding protein FerR (iron transport regulator)